MSMPTKPTYFSDSYYALLTEAAKKAYPKISLNAAIDRYIKDRLGKAIEKDLGVEMAVTQLEAKHKIKGATKK